MANLVGDNLNKYKQNEEEFPANIQQSAYIQDQTNDIYVVNLILIFLYYGFLIYYAYYAYGSFRYSTLYYRKLFMLILLFAYPFIVYQVQYGVYNFGRYVAGLVYNNVYDTKSW
jgi:hypothetical protein